MFALFNTQLSNLKHYPVIQSCIGALLVRAIRVYRLSIKTIFMLFGMLNRSLYHSVTM
jgi:hypothetical protein